MNVNALTEKIRRTIHSLEKNTELRDLISEEQDVLKGYENIMKQNNDKVQYLNKWGSKEPEYQQLFQIVYDHNTAHNATIADFVKKDRAYLNGLKEILAKADKLHHEDKVVHELEEKVNKKKASENTLQEARKKRDAVFQEYESMKSTMLKESIINLTKAYCEMYSAGLMEMNKQLNALNNLPSAHQQPVNNVNQPGPFVQQGGPQYNYGQPQSNPPQSNYAQQQGNPPPGNHVPQYDPQHNPQYQQSPIMSSGPEQTTNPTMPNNNVVYQYNTLDAPQHPDPQPHDQHQP